MLTTSNMLLKSWNLITDKFNHTELAANWTAIDAHNHTTGKGPQIPSGGIVDLAITTAKIADVSITTGKLALAAVTGPTIAAGAIDVTKVTVEAWIAPTLLTTWVNVGGGARTAGYYKDVSGNIWLKGLVSKATAPTTGESILTLPIGYQPLGTATFSIYTGGGSVRCDITAAGGVTLVTQAGYSALSATQYSLDGIHFRP